MKYYKETETYTRKYQGPHIYALDFKEQKVRVYYVNRKKWTKWEPVLDFNKYIKYFDIKDHFEELSYKETFFEVL